MMFTVTPSNSPACAPNDKASANIAPAIAVDRIDILAMLSFLPISSAPRAAIFSFGLSSQPLLRQRLQGSWSIRLPIDRNYTGGPLDASTRHKRGDEDQIGDSAPNPTLESVIGRIELTPP